MRKGILAAALAAVAVMGIGWTLSVCSPTNGIVCVSVIEPCTNVWVLEASTNGSDWAGIGQYVTGNVERCMFAPPSDAPPNAPWADVQFYRLRLVSGQ